MIKTIKIFFRKFLHQKAINLLSISGLSIGIAVALVMGWWTINEFSFDSFNEDGDSIYRVGREGFINNETIHVASCFAPLAADCQQSFPEVQETLRFLTEWNNEMEADLIKAEEDLLIADSNFFSFFTYPLSLGNKEDALLAPSSIVISKSLAQKYFPNINPMGRTISVEHKEWVVSGVMMDIPSNSHLQFDAVIPMHAFPNLAARSYGSNDSYYTYFKLQENSDLGELEKKVTQLTHEKAAFLKDIPIHHFIQPLADIHFGSNEFRFDAAVSGDKRLVLILTIMALSILAIACINFTNLFISTSFLRLKSLAVKKSNGASQSMLIKEFFYETSIYVIISLTLGLVLALMALPVFNQLAGSNIAVDYSDFRFYVFLIGIGLFTILLAGSVPAFSMAKIDVVTALKGKSKNKSISIIQKGLVILQFTASIILLITVITIKKQVYYMQHADLGFTKEHTLSIRATGAFSKDYQTIKQELEKSPFIEEVTVKNSLPSEWNNGNVVTLPGNSADPFIMEFCHMKHNYFNMLEIALVDGIPMDLSTETSGGVWLNEAAVKVLGLEQAVGTELLIDGEGKQVKGVYEDVRTKSLHIGVDPQLLQQMHGVEGYYKLLIRISGNQQAAIKTIEDKWKAVNPDEDFEFRFLDDIYQDLYHAEIRTSKIVSWGMAIALFLTAIGLFAMASYSTQTRTKEIGIRKVNGATVLEILSLLNKDFMKWVILAFVIAIPFAYYLMNSWLQNFAFRTELSWWVFALAGFIALLISIITVTWRSWRAARRNPVEALRYE